MNFFLGAQKRKRRKNKKYAIIYIFVDFKMKSLKVDRFYNYLKEIKYFSMKTQISATSHLIIFKKWRRKTSVWGLLKNDKQQEEAAAVFELFLNTSLNKKEETLSPW